MPEKIQVYVKFEKKLVREHLSAPISDGVMTHTCLDKKMLEYEKTLPETEKEVLDYATNLAEKKDLTVEVIDLSALKGRLKASTRGVRGTPTIIVGDERVENVDLTRSKEKLDLLLNESKT
jgi:ABC-type lipoprotein export system ATPase subunit